MKISKVENMIENMIKQYASLIKQYVAKLSNTDYMKIRKVVMEAIDEEDKRRGIR